MSDIIRVFFSLSILKQKKQKQKKMTESEREVYLSEMYYNVRNSGAYGGLKRFYNSIKHDGKFNFTKAQIQSFLNDQDGYSLQKPIRYKFPRNHIVTSGIDSMWDADLADMQQISTSNDGVRYLLIVIDVFSRNVWVEPLQSKTGIHLVKAMTSVFQS
jgi:hypothetical protein